MIEHALQLQTLMDAVFRYFFDVALKAEFELNASDPGLN